MSRLPSPPPFPFRDPNDNRIHASNDGSLSISTGSLVVDLKVGHSNFSVNASLFDPADAPNAPGGVVAKPDPAGKGTFTVTALTSAGAPAQPTSGSVNGGAGTFNITPGQHTDFEIDGVAAPVKTWAGTKASRTGVGGTFAALDTLTLLFKVDGGGVQTATMTGAETNAATAATKINGDTTGCTVTVVGGQLKIESDRIGTGSSIEITGGTGLAALGFTVAAATNGTGDASNMAAVTRAEAAAALNAVIPTATATGAGSLLTILSKTTGTTSSVKLLGTSDQSLGITDNNLRSGTFGPVRVCFEARVGASVRP